MMGSSSGNISAGTVRGNTFDGVHSAGGLGEKTMMTDEMQRFAITINHANKIETSTLVKGVSVSGSMERFLQRYLHDGTFSVKVEKLCPDGIWRKV